MEIFLKQSERVKSVELHPTEPWILVGLYSGTVCIWNYKSQNLEKEFKVTESSPVRSAKFIARQNWIVVGSDDGIIRVYNYGTGEKIQEFKAHEDYIRCLAVHPLLPYVISTSDDKLVKLWDWEKDWSCGRVFEGHSHYVMQIAFHPNVASSSFATASLDGTIKIWNIECSVPAATIEASSKGMNCVDYLMGDGDKHHLVAGSDDFTAKVLDGDTKNVTRTLEGHTNNVAAVAVHPNLPLILTGSEDGSVRIWNSTDFSFLRTLNHGLERVWSIGCMEHLVVFGCDKGTILLDLKNCTA